VIRVVPQTPMAHPFDARINHGYIVWHDDPNIEALICDVVNRVDPDVFIETGTHMGWTAHWMAKRFLELEIWSCEVDVEYHKKSSENLAGFAGVELTQGDSRGFMREAKKRLETGERDSFWFDEVKFDSRDRALPMFWLDAHWYPPVPLREECAVVATLPRYVCLIDDFRCEAPHFDGDVFQELDGRRVDNDQLYTADIMGPVCWRPAWASWPGCKGVALFTKGIDYEPPAGLMKQSRLW
jgi:hypothetical protein